MIELAIVSLLGVIISGIAGLAWSGFKDNLAQNVGLVIICWIAGLRIDRILETRYVSELAAIFYFGLACYFLGTAWKSWQYHQYERQNRVKKVEVK